MEPDLTWSPSHPVYKKTSQYSGSNLETTTTTLKFVSGLADAKHLDFTDGWFWLSAAPITYHGPDKLKEKRTNTEPKYIGNSEFTDK